MTTKPALHIFPPVEEVHKRRESLDELIRKSMDMRPTGPWPQKNDGHPTKSKARVGRKSPGPIEAIAIRIESPASDAAKVTAQVYEMKPIAKPPRPNPHPLQVPVTNPRRSSSTSPSSARPRRRPSNSAYQRHRSPAPARPDPPIANSGSANSSQYSSPISPADSVDSAPAMTDQTAETSPGGLDRDDLSSRALNRKRVIAPSPVDGSEQAVTATAGLQRKNSSRASNRPLQRQVSSRASNRSRVVFPTASSPDRRRMISPTPSEQTYVQSGSPTLGRSNSVTTWKGQSPISANEKGQMRSIFPTYDHSVPFARQVYRLPSSHIAPIRLPSEKVCKPEYSPNSVKEMQLPLEKEPIYITPASDLSKLWDYTNGQIGIPEPRTFTMKMFRASSGAKKQKISFGPDESQPFYSISQSHPSAPDDDPSHEVLIFRHSVANDDILPICHSMLQPPPPPNLSRANRLSANSESSEPGTQITAITPILATLHSLDNAAKTPQAHTLALVDPRATSPAAARLAERAVADAIARESCALTWTRTCPKNGKYELHHPTLGAFSVHTEGNVASGFEKKEARGPTSIYITNPYANPTPISSSPASFGSGESSKTRWDRNEPVLARLDLQEDILHLDAAAIAQLGNLYLIDVCVSALLSVAVAETQRPADPGLVFAAPPPSPFDGNFKRTNKKEKAPKEPKPSKKKAKKSDSNSGMSLNGIEHLAEEEELPRITRGILSVLGFSFKTAVFLLGVGIKLTASMVVSLSKLAS